MERERGIFMLSLFSRGSSAIGCEDGDVRDVNLGVFFGSQRV